MSDPDDRAALEGRRDFLRLAILAPVAVAGCAGAGAGAASRGPDGGSSAASKAGEGAQDGESAADAIRAVPLAMDVEPAFVFRAGRGE
ncbi:MAG TPA: hypothetical protein VD838_19585 [Anaeromyxobacteraceae bacterium]|nr:hypothetical protein [Anaeromyxobacteraceae bacterium]